jgi:hypothetical protein
MKKLVPASLLMLAVTSTALAHPLDGRAPPALRDYFTLGVEHILGGFDHLLFVLGLLIATRSLRTLLITTSAFTVAHSITLGLGLLELVTPNGAVIEVLIALSIAYVGYENWRMRAASFGEVTEPPKKRLWIVLFFGLAHGFGFAGAVHDVGLPPSRELQALALFNLGVEAGQLGVVAIAWPLIAMLRRAARAERVVAQLVNALLLVAGLGWTLERSLIREAPASVAVASAAPFEASAALTAMRAAPSPAAAVIAPGATSPWIAPLCHALHALPRERRAQCSGEKPGALLTSACEHALSASVQGKALRIDAARAEQCIDGLRARYEGCEWSTARVLPPLAACQGLLEGARAQGTSCASSLECAEGLHCRGAGAFDRGVCAPPLPDGARCELAADPLGSYMPSEPNEHRECQNRCTQGRCG